MTPEYSRTLDFLRQIRQARERRQAQEAAQAQLAQAARQPTSQPVVIPRGIKEPTPSPGILSRLGQGIGFVAGQPGIRHALSVLSDPVIGAQQTLVRLKAGEGLPWGDGTYTPGQEAFLGLGKPRSGSFFQRLGQRYSQMPFQDPKMQAEMAEAAGIGGKTQFATGMIFDPSIVIGGGLGARAGVGAARWGTEAAEAAKRVTAQRVVEAFPQRSIAATIPSERALLREGVDPSWSTKALRSLDQLQVGKVRPLSFFVRSLDPSAVAVTPVEKGLLSYNRLLNVGDNMWGSFSARAKQSFDDATRGKVDIGDVDGIRVATMRLSDDAKRLLKVKENPTIHDFFERRGTYERFYDDAQRDFANMWSSLRSDMVRLQRSHGVKVNELILKDPKDVWMPRLVQMIRGEEVVAGVKRAPGSKQPFERPRWHELTADGIGNRVQYGTDLVAGMEVAFKGAIHSIADARLARRINTLPGVRTGKAATQPALELAQATKDVGYARSMGRAILTAARGKQVAGATTAAIERARPGTGLRDAIKRGDGDELFDLLEHAATWERDASALRKSALSAVKRSRAANNAVKKGEVWVDKPLFRGKIYPKEIGDALNTHFKSEIGSIMRVFRGAADISRSLGTTIDLGWNFIQGQVLLARRPADWARVMGLSIAALFDPTLGSTRIIRRVMAKDDMFAASQQAASFGVVQGGQVSREMVAGVSAAGKVARAVAPHLGPARAPIELIGRPVGWTFNRFSDVFGEAGDLARTYYWKSLSPIAAKRAGQTGSRQAFDELADFINKSTGVISSSHLGLSAQQQARETLIMFAPRFARASIGLFNDTLHGGMRGELAREALVNLAMAGTLTYVAIGKAIGQEPNFDPRSGKFFTYNIGGNNVGIGGAQISIIRMLGHATISLEKDPGGLIKLDDHDQPFIKWLRGKMSPPGSAAWEIVNGRTYIGEPTRDNPTNFLKNVVATRLTPFWAEQFLWDNPTPGLGGIGEFGGLRTFPTSLWDKRNDIRQQVSGDRWDELTRLEKMRLEAAHPELKRATEMARAQNVDRADPEREVANEYFDKLAGARQKFLDDVALAQQEMELTSVHPRVFREKFDLASRDRRRRIEDLMGDTRYDPIRRDLDRYTAEQRRPIADVAYDHYLTDVVANDLLTDEFGNYDFDQRALLEQEFTAKWGPEVLRYVKSVIEAGRQNDPILAKELRALRSDPSFRARWETDKAILQQMGRLELLGAYRDYSRRDISPLEKEAILEAYPIFKQVDRVVSRARRIMQEKNARLDASLYRFGYTTKLRHKDNIGREQSILDFG